MPYVVGEGCAFDRIDIQHACEPLWRTGWGIEFQGLCETSSDLSHFERVS
jgi:hypothetical protein